MPPYGWRPDPSWPTPPTRHAFWRRTPRGRRRHRLQLLALCLVSALLMGGCVAAFSADDGSGCVFDPPPGDVSSVSIVNDSEATVDVIADYYPPAVLDFSDAAAVAPGARTGVQHELCSDDQVAVTDTRHRVIGCLRLPIQDPQKVFELSVSQATPCS